MNFKSVLKVLVSLTAVAATKNNYKGKCKDLENTLEKYVVEDSQLLLYGCELDNKGNAVNYTLNIDCGYGDFSLTQEFINDLSTFTNLEKLTLDECVFQKDDLNFEPLNKLEKLIEIHFIRSSDNNDLINYFKHLKTLIYGRCAPDTISNNNVEKLILNDAEYYESKVNLEGLPNLKYLTITSSSDDAGDLDIRMPKNLIFLSLSKYNPTEDLIKQIVANKNLESLTFEFYEFESEKYDLTPLKKLTKLTELNLSNWMSDYKIKVPDFVFSLKNLRTLELTNVENTEILEKIDNLKNLESLTLKEDGLTSIDKIVNLKNLEYLNLFGNEITTISNKIDNLKNLKYLDLSYGKFKKLPETLSNLKNLESLNLYHSELTEIPEFLNDLPKLRYIDFVDCENITKGKTLTNDSLEECYYGGIESKICKAKEMSCLQYFEKEIKPCTDNSNKISTNGKCGATDGRCPTGQCCSKYGYCGTSNKHCGTGCQSEFGQCTSTNVKISSNGKCGAEDGQCPSGQCCSKYGYCGTSDKHCKTGCQSQYGKCL